MGMSKREQEKSVLTWMSYQAKAIDESNYPAVSILRKKEIKHPLRIQYILETGDDCFEDVNINGGVRVVVSRGYLEWLENRAGAQPQCKHEFVRPTHKGDGKFCRKCGYRPNRTTLGVTEQIARKRSKLRNMYKKTLIANNFSD